MFKGYAVALLAVLFFSASAQATANKGVVRAVRGGSAEISSDKGKSWKKAAVGMAIAANSAIKTDSTAVVDVFLGDNGPVVRVNPNSQLGFDKLDVQNSGIEKIIETQLDLKSGQILGNVKKMAAASKYEVKTPHGVAGIRGTEYSISADGTVSVVSGTVVVVYIIGDTPQPPITITQGNQASPPGASGQPAPIVASAITQGTIADITVGIKPTADGGYTITLDNGKVLEFDSSGNPKGGDHGGGGPAITPGPDTTTTDNFDLNGPLTRVNADGSVSTVNGTTHSPGT